MPDPLESCSTTYLRETVRCLGIKITNFSSTVLEFNTVHSLILPNRIIISHWTNGACLSTLKISVPNLFSVNVNGLKVFIASQTGQSLFGWEDGVFKDFELPELSFETSTSILSGKLLGPNE